MRTDILGHPPSLCNCRRVWHPCHTHAATQGVQWSPLHQPSKNCTNQAATASSHRIHRTHRSLLLKCIPTEFTEFSCRGELLCILRVPWDNTTQPKHLCHLCYLWEDYLGLPHAPTQGVQLSQLHQPSKKCTNRAATASSHRIHRTHRSLLLKCTPTKFTEFSCRGELLCILRVPWDNTTQPKHLWASVPSVGGLLSGWRGYGRDAIPS